jgi:hypothetical protein
MGYLTPPSFILQAKQRRPSKAHFLIKSTMKTLNQKTASKKFAFFNFHV